MGYVLVNNTLIYGRSFPNQFDKHLGGFPASEPRINIRTHFR